MPLATPGPRTPEPVAVETLGLTRTFGSVVAVDHLDLTVAAGTIFGLIGPNGAGKTTTIKILTTLLRPSAGSARVAGYDVTREARQVRQHIGYVPQLLSADSALTGRENLALSARLYGIARRERRRRIDEALDFMDLTEFAGTLVRNYSGGRIRRLEIAQALLHRPAVLFLDEPTVGLDPVARQAVWKRLQDLRSAMSTSVLVTTHDMEEADALCQVIALMHRGQIAALGSPAALKAEVGPSASLGDVFIRFTGATVEHGGEYREVARTRRTTRRLS